MKTTTLIIALLIFSSLSYAQSTGTTRTATMQLTLITPIGTNGSHSGNTINNISINLLGGYHAGLRGFEWGGLANLNRDFAYGFQFAGLANYTGGEANGVQCAGIANFNSTSTSIIQFAGIGNANIGLTKGLQFAGIGNYAGGTSNVFQAGGIANYAENITGFQIAGIANAASGDIEGGQIAGIVNFSPSAKGVQIAGIANTTEYVNGAQIAGILNIAKNVNGVQIGVLNIADTVRNGIPIGVLSIVRDGFHEFEIGFSEGLNTYASFKIGVKQFYNIFSIGSQFLNNNFRWAVGYGIGTHLANTESYNINLEAISYQINEGTSWTNAYNGLQQVKLTYAGVLNQHTNFFVGPTFNLMVSDYKNSDGKQGSDFPPYHFIDHMSGNTNLKFWVGLNIGLRIH